MRTRENYMPGPASGAQVRKEGEQRTLILVRDLAHPPTRVWQALTDPAHLREWSPFDADRDLSSPGPVKLTTVGVPGPLVSETRVRRAEAAKVLEFSWGGHAIQRLEAAEHRIREAVRRRGAELVSGVDRRST